MRMIFVWITVAFIAAVAWIFISEKTRRVPEFTDANCIRALVGEYARDDYYGMKIMAHAIRNRKTLKGVYGYCAKHSKKESRHIWILASLAWFDSEKEKDPLQGAAEWRSRDDLSEHSIPKGMALVKIYDGNYYYKHITKKGGHHARTS